MGDLDPRLCSANQTGGSDKKCNHGYFEAGFSFPFSLSQEKPERCVVKSEVCFSDKVFVHVAL